MSSSFSFNSSSILGTVDATLLNIETCSPKMFCHTSHPLLQKLFNCVIFLFTLQTRGVGDSSHEIDLLSQGSSSSSSLSLLRNAEVARGLSDEDLCAYYIMYRILVYVLISVLPRDIVAFLFLPKTAMFRIILFIMSVRTN